MDLAKVKPATFEPHLGTIFEALGSEGDRISLRLDAVQSLGVPPHPSRQEPFSIVFVGPSEPVLEQRIHTLEHVELGRIEIFLVPIGVGAGGRQRYEAVFN